MEMAGCSHTISISTLTTRAASEPGITPKAKTVCKMCPDTDGFQKLMRFGS